MVHQGGWGQQQGIVGIDPALKQQWLAIRVTGGGAITRKTAELAKGGSLVSAQKSASKTHRILSTATPG